MAEARRFRRKQKKDMFERVRELGRLQDPTRTEEFPSGEFALYSWGTIPGRTGRKR